MVKVSVRVSSGAARFGVTVRAESVERALKIVEKHNPGKEVLPIDPGTSFVRETAGSSRREEMVI